ncbi:MAG: TIGR04283 family arsenosugar biosynthesis glycosyltransferase [bacterium]
MATASIPVNAPGVNRAIRFHKKVTLSVIVPTFNEEAIIVATLQHSRATLSPHELIVADGSSTDRTVERSRAYATVIACEASRGAGLNAAAAIATGDVLLFLHADTIVPSGAADAISDALADPAVVGGAFRLRFDHRGRLASFVARSVNVRSHLFNTFFGDQAMFVRRDVFARAGGFSDWSVMEDLEILRRLRRHGRLVLLDLSVITSARRHENRGWLRTLVTVWVLSFLHRIGISGRTLRRLYGAER